jgi:phosphoribosylanthranilate isomerase
VEDGRVALQAGADLLGFIFWPRGKRYIAPDDAARIIDSLRRESSTWSAVGVFVDPTPEEVQHATRACQLDVIQLSGNERPELVGGLAERTIKAVHVRAGEEERAVHDVQRNTYGADMYLLDTHAEGLPGGTGVPFDWPALRAIGSQCWVAGGLRPDNVAEALAALSPLGVDVSSGVEFPASEGGHKDPHLIHAFLEAVRTYDARP